MKKLIFYSIKRCFQLGLYGLIAKIYYHHRKATFIKKNKIKALCKQASNSWNDICSKNTYFETLYNHPLFIKYRPSHNALLEWANRIITSKNFLLGAPVTVCSWHDDFTAPTRPSKTFTNQDFGKKHAHTFYADITLPQLDQHDFSHYSYDVKAPWERSRFNEFFALGYAYQEIKTQTYADHIKQKLTSWLDENSYLLGVNWVCPMDVAIRAINIIWALYFFRNASSSWPKDFLQRIESSLYDHLIYLDNNWEYSDKPNNHYITELLGFAYLCTFFNKQKNFTWAKKKLKQQFKFQIQADGTSYEGSSAYHRLDTELCLHAVILGCIDESLFKSMINFLEKSAIKQNTIVTIGDDDSGKITTGITITPARQNYVTTYKDFGLTVIRYQAILITFRHATFNPRQPTGHFHQDQLSVTVSKHGHQILIDPGSYLYTSNAVWRNHFRSYEQHNTFAINCSCCKPTNNLFQLARGKKSAQPEILETTDTISLTDWYQPCLKNSLKLFRTLTFNKDSLTLSITDHAQEYQQNEALFWNFLLHPRIIIDQKNDIMTLKNHTTLYATFTSPLTWEKKQNFYAPEYGKKQSCIALKSNALLQHPVTHTIELNMDWTKT